MPFASCAPSLVGQRMYAGGERLDLWGRREHGRTERRKVEKREGGKTKVDNGRPNPPACTRLVDRRLPAWSSRPSVLSLRPPVLPSSCPPVFPSSRPSVLPPTSTDSRHDLPRPCSDHRAHRHHPLLQGVAPGGGASHAHEQSRSRRRRATRGADRLRRGREGGA